jgi:hypothetical protein
MSDAEAPLEVLADFAPRYACGRPFGAGDSAADLEEAGCSSCSAELAPDGPCDADAGDDAGVLRALRAAARRRGARGGRLGLADYSVVKQGQKGGFGRVAVARVDGVATAFALKTVRSRAPTTRSRSGARSAHVRMCGPRVRKRSRALGRFSRRR